jgi:phage/plasmid-associated DNA primase
MDVFADFLEECCTLEAGGESTSEELYRAYKRWCSQRKENPLSQRAFGSRLKERGLEPSRLGSGQRIWQGIALQEVIESMFTQHVLQ